MSLRDYEQAKFLGTGWHTVKITELRFFEAHSGNSGVEYTVADASGAEGRVSAMLLEKCYWKLASLARACGLTDDEMDAIDPANRDHYSRLIGRKLRVYSEIPDGRKYHEIVDFMPDDGTEPPDRPAPIPEAYKAPSGPPDAGLAAAADEVPF
ncbi:MAG: hypothetical protein ACE5EX_03230 [Phycisphaerae bacterium]